MEQLTAYINRDNEERLELLQGGLTVTAEAVTRAVLRSDSFCIDSDVDAETIYFDENNTILCIKPGLIDGLEANTSYRCYLTIFDGSTDIGYAWVNLKIKAYAWDVCDT